MWKLQYKEGRHAAVTKHWEQSSPQCQSQGFHLYFLHHSSFRNVKYFCIFNDASSSPPQPCAMSFYNCLWSAKRTIGIYSVTVCLLSFSLSLPSFLPRQRRIFQHSSEVLPLQNKPVLFRSHAALTHLRLMKTMKAIWLRHRSLARTQAQTQARTCHAFAMCSMKRCSEHNAHGIRGMWLVKKSMIVS